MCLLFFYDERALGVTSGPNNNFYKKVFPISRAIFPLRPHFITGEYRVIIIIISIIIIIIIIIIVTIVAVAIAPNILFYIDRSIVTVTVVFMVDKFVKPSQTNLS